MSSVRQYDTVTAKQILGDKNYSWEAYISQCPWEVQEMAKKYPPCTRFLMHGKVSHLIAYCEDGVMQVTELDPCENHEAALAAAHPICDCCLGKLDSLIID